MKPYIRFALPLCLALSGCAINPVNVQSALPVSPIAAGDAVRVLPNEGEADWAAEQALHKWGQPLDSRAVWRLQVSERMVIRGYMQQDPFCRPWYGRSYARDIYGRPVYWMDRGRWVYSDPWCQPQVQWTPRRTITWVVQDTQGQIVWSASAIEPDVDHPPLQASDRLAQALIEWIRRVPAH